MLKTLTLLALLNTPIMTMAQPATGHATIQGHVFDQAGQPVYDADISFMPLDHDDVRNQRKVTSKADGSYTITVPAPSKIRLYVYKEAANVPNTRTTLFKNGKDVYTELSVEDGGVFDNVDLKLPAPYGTLSVAVVDSKTHLPAFRAQLTLRRLENPSIYIRASMKDSLFHFALPERPVTISIEAPGYKPWSYVEERTGNNYLKISPSDSITLTVELTPTSN